MPPEIEINGHIIPANGDGVLWLVWDWVESNSIYDEPQTLAVMKDPPRPVLARVTMQPDGQCEIERLDGEDQTWLCTDSLPYGDDTQWFIAPVAIP